MSYIQLEIACFFLEFIKLLMGITGRLAQNCCITMISKVNGKTGILTPGRPETPENFITKTGHIDYVVVSTKFMRIGPVVPAPPIAEI